MLSAAVLCLALNVHYEAEFEPYMSQLGVAMVTVNRMHENHRTACAVVFRRKQFSWTIGKQRAAIRQLVPKNTRRWRHAIEVARTALRMPRSVRPLHGALFYHADYIQPPIWTADKQVVAHYGHHIFYK